jgi:hypothetical protein
MGNDADIYAVNSKQAFYFDRYYNFYANNHLLDDKSNSEIIERLANRHPLGELKPDVTAKEVEQVCLYNVLHWLKESDEDYHRAVWNIQILRFVRSFPDDLFFIRSNSDCPGNLDEEYAVGGESNIYRDWLP